MNRMVKFYKDLIFISKIVDTSNKKLKILISVLFSNLVIVCDLIVIILFAHIIDNSAHENFVINEILLFSDRNKYFLPVIVLLRFLFVYLDRMNLEILKLKIQESLRLYFIKEVFDKGNYSISDAFFYVNSLSIHVSTFYGSLAALISFLLQILIFSSYLILTNTEVVGVFTIGAFIFYFPTKFFVKMLRKYSHQSYLSLQEINKNVEKVLDNLYLIKILKKINYEISNYNRTQKNFLDAQINNLKFGTLNSILPNFVTVFILAVLLSFFNFSDILTLEFIGILLRLFQTLGNFNRSLSITTNTHVHLEQLHNIDKNKGISNIENFKDVYSLEEINDSSVAVKFTNVDFKYFNSENKIFSNLNFDIKKNKHTVITGQNGSGKSTILGLISGVFYASSGKVDCYAQNIGYIGAKPMIFNGSLRENLLYGTKKDITDHQLNDYLTKFSVFNTPEENTLDLEVSNKSLSSGQMQKISFIRALLMEVDLLILDESTSNLDDDSKKLIFEILNNFELTIINSTHNLGSFINYDEHIKIVTKETGRELLLAN
jgi:ABC-type multidrug transport system fused ATPase/permease subunit